MNETKCIKNIEDLKKLINTAKNGIIRVKSNIIFDIDVVELHGFSLYVEGDIKAVKISVYNISAYNINACTINAWGDIHAHSIDLLGCIICRNIDASSISAYSIKAEGYIKSSNIKADLSVKASSLKIGNCKTNDIIKN